MEAPLSCWELIKSPFRCLCAVLCKADILEFKLSCPTCHKTALAGRDSRWLGCGTERRWEVGNLLSLSPCPLLSPAQGWPGAQSG